MSIIRLLDSRQIVMLYDCAGRHLQSDCSCCAILISLSSSELWQINYRDLIHCRSTRTPTRLGQWALF